MAKQAKNRQKSKCVKNSYMHKERNSYLNAVEAKYMTTSHMMWKNWCLITFCTLSKSYTSIAIVFLSP